MLLCRALHSELRFHRLMKPTQITEVGAVLLVISQLSAFVQLAMGGMAVGGQILNPDSATTELRFRPLHYDGKKQKPKNSGCKRIIDYINNIQESYFVL